MEKEELEKIIVGTNYFKVKKILEGTGYYYRPISVNKIILWKDVDIDSKRCNVIVENEIIIKIDGWY
jgi:hypothetical protein